LDPVPGNPWQYLSVALDANGYQTGEVAMLEEYPAGLPPPSIPVLVYSRNPQNTAHRLLMRNTNKALWLNPHGDKAGGPLLYTTPRTAYTGCEYWGTASRLAHSFTNYTYGYKDNVRHMHWSTTPATSPQESYILGYPSFVPVACASTERQDLYDDELLLVSKYTAGALGQVYVYWTMEAEH
jgi:hypothetical protein